MIRLTGDTRGVEWAFYVRPRDGIGNYLGPGFAKEIKLAMPRGTVADHIADLGNGTYVFLFTVPPGSDPEINLTAFGQEMIAGRISQIAESDAGIDFKGIWIFIVLVCLGLIAFVLWVIKRRQE